MQEGGVESSEDEDEDVVDLEDIGGTMTTAGKRRKGTKGVTATGMKGAIAQGCEGDGETGRGGAMEEKGGGSGAPREMVTPVIRQSLTKQGQLDK